MAAIRAFIRALWGLLITTAVLGGTAAGLIWWAGWPLPDHWPSNAEMTAFAEDPLTYPVSKAIIACAGWLLWLTLTKAVVLQTWTQLSRRPLRLRLPRPLQLVTAGLFGVGVLNLAGPAQAHDLAVSTSSAVTSEQTTPPAQTTVTPSAAPSPAAVHPGNAFADPHRGKLGTTARPHEQDGVALPSGWIAWPLASGILATSAAALLHGWHPQAASALLRGIRAARHPQPDPAADESNQPVTVDDIALLERDANTQTELCIASIDGEVLTVDAIPRSGVGLAGPGVADALRGLLAATAATSQARTMVIVRPYWTDWHPSTRDCRMCL